jgi:hypothetical protein
VKQTVTLQYFTKRFPAPTLAGSIERAANLLRGGLFGHLVPVPVDVDAIAAEHGICITPRSDAGGPEGELVPTGGGFTIYIRGTATRMRRRFSIAHELAHTLFYLDEGIGNRHRVAVLSREETEAEEFICNAVAGALLIPQVNLQRELRRIAVEPWELLYGLDSLARKFQVSYPALIRSLERVSLKGPNALVACMHLAPNRKTGRDTQPRILTARVLGVQSRQLWMWSNRSAVNAGFISGAALLHRWHETYPGHEPSHGRFVLEAGDIVRPNKQRPYPLVEETLEVSTHRRGEWRRLKISTQVAYCLYAVGGRRKSETYVVAVAELPPIDSPERFPEPRK